MDSEAIYADGTFTYCAKYFTQVFTLHGFQNGHYIPLVFCLLIDKSIKSYELCFKKIVTECSKMNLVFKPTKFVIDFEQAIHRAVKSLWPETTVVGCRFHLSQAWWRKIQQLGLDKEYKNRSEIGKFLKYTFGLQYLDAEEVGDCVAFDMSSIQPNDPRVTEYMDYLIDTYVSEDSMFSPEIWASASSHMTRTTNAPLPTLC